MVAKWGRAAEDGSPRFFRETLAKKAGERPEEAGPRDTIVFCKPWETVGRKVMGLNAGTSVGETRRTLARPPELFPSQTRGNPGTQSHGATRRKTHASRAAGYNITTANREKSRDAKPGG